MKTALLRIPITVSALVCLILCSCTSNDDIYMSRREILRMNPELQRVLDHCSADEEKLRAAEFLIDNLPYHYGVVYTDMAPQNLAYELFGSGKYTQFESRDSVVRRYGYWGVKNPNYRNDVFIDPDFLIDNIDWAFKVWREQPWGKNVSFEQFCEYVLPYRVGNEELYSWREKIYNQFQPIINALPNDSNKLRPEYVVTVLMDSILRDPVYFTEEISSQVHVGPRIVDTRGGSCLDMSDMMLYICRALGIPCGIDYMPMRGNNNAPHFINFIEGVDGYSYYFSILYRMGRVFHCELIRDVYGKMYRKTFSINKELVKKADMPISELHPSFRYPCFKDVTRTYARNRCWDLRIPRNKLFLDEDEGNQLLYLCMSNRHQWQPVDFAWLVSDTIVFKECHGEVTYSIGRFNPNQNELTIISDPFWVEKDSCKLTFYTPSKDTEDVILLNKFSMVTEFFIWRMKDGVFEGSNDRNFSKIDTLYQIPVAPERLYTHVLINNPNTYQYLRYRGADGSYCDVSEVAFYSAQEPKSPLKGEIIGPESGQEGSHSYFNVYDENTCTSYNHPTPDGGWAGIALSKPTTIGAVVYTPRNRDNFVRPGDTYELFAFEQGEWNSLGIQVSTSDSLLYHGVPQNALLLLRNHSRGVAERLFEYKDGKQHYK